MHRRAALGRTLVAPAALCLLGACASTARSLPTPYAVRVRVDDGVNPDSRARAAPIVLKFFELKGSGGFETADYFSLQDRDRATLAEDLVHSQQVIMRSGETRTFKREASLESRAIGLIAGYRKLEDARWRIVVPLKEPKQTNLYKVWQFAPGEQLLDVVVRRDGLELVTRS